MRAGHVGKAVVEIGVDEPADQRAPARARAADHDHHEQGEREARARHLGARAADQDEVDDAADRREERREHEGHQFEVERAQAEHLDAQLVLADRLPDAARRRVDRPATDQEDADGVRERQPVEVLRVQDPDEPGGQLRVVDAEAVLAAGPAVGVLEREHRARLRERERDHREGDPAHAQADGAEDQW